MEAPRQRCILFAPGEYAPASAPQAMAPAMCVSVGAAASPVSTTLPITGSRTGVRMVLVKPRVSTSSASASRGWSALVSVKR